MPSWISRLRGTQAAGQDATPAAQPAKVAPPAENLVAIEIYTNSGAAFPADVDRGDERITDLLNGADSLALHGTADTADLAVDEMLLVVPPADRWNDAQRRLHRIRRPVRFKIGPYEIDGNAHVPPGAHPSGYLFRVNPRFVPLTEAVIRRLDGEADERRLPVVIANFRRLGEMAELKPDEHPLLVADLKAEEEVE